MRMDVRMFAGRLDGFGAELVPLSYSTGSASKLAKMTSVSVEIHLEYFIAVASLANL